MHLSNTCVALELSDMSGTVAQFSSQSLGGRDRWVFVSWDDQHPLGFQGNTMSQKRQQQQNPKQKQNDKLQGENSYD